MVTAFLTYARLTTMLSHLFMYTNSYIPLWFKFLIVAPYRESVISFLVMRHSRHFFTLKFVYKRRVEKNVIGSLGDCGAVSHSKKYLVEKIKAVYATSRVLLIIALI